MNKAGHKNITQKLFFANAFIFLATSLSRQVYPPMLLSIEGAFHISHGLSGLLITLAYIGYAIFRFPSGLLSAYLGNVPIIIYPNILLVLSLLLVYISPNYLVLAFATFLMGCMTGAYITAGYSFGTVIGGKDRVGRSTGVLETFGTLGSVIAPFMVTLFLVWFTWREVFLLIAVLLALLILSFYNITKSYDEKLLQVKVSKDFFKEIWSQQLQPFMKELQKNSGKKFLIWATLVGGIEGIAWLGFLYFIPTYLVVVRGFEQSLANYFYLIPFLVALVTKTYIGILADRFGYLKVLFLSILVSFFATITFTFTTSLWMMVFLLSLMGMFMLSLNTIINSYVLNRMSGPYQGIGFGLFGTLYTIIYSLGPGLSGFIADAFGLQVAMKTMPIIFLIVIPFVLKPLIKEF